MKEKAGEETGDSSDVGDGSGGTGDTERVRSWRGRATAATAQSQPIFYLAGHNGAALVEPVMLELGWKRTPDKNCEQCKLKWTECITQVNYTSFKEGELMVNHIPNCGLITNKLGLLMSLRDYERMSKTLRNRVPALPMADFFPETYVIDDKREREAFFQAHKEGDIWINKPTGSNQGKGITMVRDMEEFQQYLADRDEESRGNPRGIKARIIQRYIKNPLLLEGRKFDIRSFMFIGCTSPYIVFFHAGYIRLSINAFSNEDTNLTTHLTNQFIQKKDPTYQLVKNDTVWSMEKFNDYVVGTYGEAKGLNKDWVKNSLNRQMQKIMLHVFHAVKNKFASRVGFFELYGLDFMVDDEMKVSLIEVNVNPAMHINCDLLKDILPPMIEETLNVAIECFEKSRKGKPLMPLEKLKNFVPIYNEANNRRGSRASPPTSLRYWVAPRFRSNSHSPARLGASDDASQLPLVTNSLHSGSGAPLVPQPSGPPVERPLPRVATLVQNRNFENSLRRYQPIPVRNSLPSSIAANQKTDSTNESTNPVNDTVSTSPTKPTEKRPTLRSSIATTYQAESSNKSNWPTDTKSQSANDRRMNKKGTNESDDPRRSSSGRFPFSGMGRGRGRPPPPREPAPITKVQVLTTDTGPAQSIPTPKHTSRLSALQVKEKRCRSPPDRSC